MEPNFEDVSKEFANSITRAIFSYTYAFIPAAGSTAYNSGVVRSLVESGMDTSFVQEQKDIKEQIKAGLKIPSLYYVHEESKKPESKEQEKKKAEKTVNFGKPQKDDPFLSRAGLSSYLNLDMNHTMGYETYPSMNKDVFIQENDTNFMKVEIYPIFRYYSFGASLTFIIVVEKDKQESKKLNMKDLHKLMKLVSSTNNEKSDLKIEYTALELEEEKKNDKRQLTLYELYEKFIDEKLFQTNVHWYAKFIKDRFKVELDADEKKKLAASIPKSKIISKYYERYDDDKDKMKHERQEITNEVEQACVDILKVLRNKRYIDDKAAQDMKNQLIEFILGNHINLFCKRYLYVNPSTDNKKESKIPWITVSFELEKNTDPWRTFCEISDDGDDTNNIFSGIASKQKGEKIIKKLNDLYKYEDIIAPFLYRLIVDYGPKHFDICYDNHFSIKPIWGLQNMYIDPRLYIQISRRSILLITSDIMEEPGKFIMPTILDMGELIYTQWQSLLILNNMLDEEIELFSKEGIEEVDSKDLINRMRIILNKYADSMASPSDYVISGDSMRELYDILLDTFKVKELQKFADRKAHLLKDLFGFAKDFHETKTH